MSIVPARICSAHGRPGAETKEATTVAAPTVTLAVSSAIPPLSLGDIGIADAIPDNSLEETEGDIWGR